MGIGNGYTVWVLGAGFSKALGGPLLADLFRPRSVEDDLVAFPKDQYPYLAWDLCLSRLFCEIGKSEGRWADAEGLLAYVDSAHRDADDRKKKILRLMFNRMKTQIPGKTLTDVDFKFARARFLATPVAIRRALAAECSAFMDETHDNDEIWQPYRAWSRTLDPLRDTVISFNYDLVLDRLSSDRHSKIRVLMPNECIEAHDRWEVPPAVVPVLKLHGSVDWVENGEEMVERSNVREILMKEEGIPFVAAPGRSKQEAVESLDPLWRVAKSRLGSADTLVIIGYGFPPSDTRARMAIQNAFGGGAGTTSDIRRIEVVLGPDTSRPEARRVHSLLEAMDHHRRPVSTYEEADADRPNKLYFKVRPLWAHDFIFDYQRRTRER